MGCCRCPRCGRWLTLGLVGPRQPGRCACGARLWLEGPPAAATGEEAAAGVPEQAVVSYLVEPDGTTRAVYLD